MLPRESLSPKARGSEQTVGEHPAPDVLDASKWPEPKWSQRPSRRLWRGYDDYLVDQLRARYLDLEGDFLTGFGAYRDGADTKTAARIAVLLPRARKGLERRFPDVGTITDELNQVERYMIWIYPAQMVEWEMPSIRARVQTLAPNIRADYTKQLDDLFDKDGNLKKSDPVQLLSICDEIIGARNDQVLRGQIDAGLQIRTLKRFFYWGSLLATLVFLIAPVAAPPDNVFKIAWPFDAAKESGRAIQLWLAPFVVAMMGAAGGYLSGLLQAKDSAVTLAEYQHSIVKLRLRPLVGILLSLITYILLVRHALLGITVDNLGTLLLIALASGFSERYFLRLMKLDGEMTDEQQTPPATPDTDANPTAGRK